MMVARELLAMDPTQIQQNVCNINPLQTKKAYEQVTTIGKPW
jgi:hypothetical protein